MGTDAQAAEAGAIGEVIGGYKLERKLAAGGMATVYAASHALLGRAAAVKLISDRYAHDEDMLSRFFYEARIVNKLRHPNIVDIFDFVKLEEPRRIACIMELLDGPSLRKLLAQGRLPLPAVFNLGAQLCDALRVVHQIGVVHRDLKPENILVVGPRGSDYSVVPSLKLLDFGIAKVQDPDAEHQTATGMLLGTPSYMAPEQISSGEITPATDVYAVAEILTEMLVGKRLYTGDTATILSSKLSGQLPDLSKLWRIEGIGRLAELITRGLSKSPEARPAVAELHNELQATLVALKAAANPPVPAQVPAPAELPTTPPVARSGSKVGGSNTPDPRVAGSVSQRLEPSQRSGRSLAPQPAPLLPPHLASQLVPAATPAPADPQAEVTLSSRLAEASPSSGASAAPLRTNKLDSIPLHGYEKKTSYTRAVVLGVLVVALAGGAFAYQRRNAERRRADLTSAQQAEATRQEEVLRGVIERWSKDLGASREVKLTDARALHLRDGWREYGQADELYRRVIVAEPSNGAALAGWAENLAVWKGDTITEADIELARTLVAMAGRTSPGPAVSRARAALALAKGDLEAAQKLAEEAVRGEPTEGEAHLALAASVLKSDAAAALREAELAAQASPDLLRTDLVRARALANLGRYGAATKLLAARIEKHPQDGNILKLYGDLERELGHPTQAREKYARAVAADGDRPAARLALGGLLLSIRESRTAEVAFRTVAEDRDAPQRYRLQALVGLARAMFANGTAPKDLPALEAALADARLAPIASILEAERKLAAGDNVRADDLASAALAQRPEGAAWVIRARASRAATDKVARILAEGLERDPFDVELRAVYTGALAGVGAGAAALDIMQQLAKLDPFERPDDPARDLAAVAPAALKEAVDRIQTIAKETKDAKVRSEAFAALAVIHDREGRSGQANEALARALRENGTNPLALWLDLRMAVEGASSARAEASSAAWTKSDPSSAIAHLMRARVLSKRGQLDDARREYEAALRADQGLKLAKIELVALGLKTGSDRVLKEVLDLQKKLPNVPRARLLLVDAGL